MSSDLKVYEPQQQQISAFANIQSFELAQRQAKALAESDLVPTMYKGKVANCLVALEVAQRCGASVMSVLQNLNIIHGRPSWSSTYIIAAINSSGRFAPLRFKMEGEGMEKSCLAWTTDKTGEVLEGPAVSMAMAKAEGWIDKTGSKWKTMPELMLRYRAAAFFGRLYAPEILMGMRTEEEEREIIDVNSTTDTPPAAVDKLNQKIKAAKKSAVEKPVVAKEPIVIEPEAKQDPAEPAQEVEHF